MLHILEKNEAVRKVLWGVKWNFWRRRRRLSFTVKVVFQSKPEGVRKWAKQITGRFYRQKEPRSRTPTALVCLEGSRKSQEGSMAEVEGTRGRVVVKRTEMWQGNRSCSVIEKMFHSEWDDTPLEGSSDRVTWPEKFHKITSVRIECSEIKVKWETR